MLAPDSGTWLPATLNSCEAGSFTKDGGWGGQDHSTQVGVGSDPSLPTCSWWLRTQEEATKRQKDVERAYYTMCFYKLTMTLFAKKSW